MRQILRNHYYSTRADFYFLLPILTESEAHETRNHLSNLLIVGAARLCWSVGMKGDDTFLKFG